MAKQQAQPKADDRVYEVEPREVTVRGKPETVHVREMSAGEAERIFGGYRKDPNDSGAVFRMRKAVVAACICNEDGRKRFADAAAVDEVSNVKINAYFKEAAAVNELGKEAGKESDETDT